MNVSDVEPATLPNGSTIKFLTELAQGMSVAEGTPAAGTESWAHYHHKTEEIYFFLAGTGKLRLVERRVSFVPEIVW